MKKFDIIVVGGGHAGIEASMASAHLGAKTALVTMSASTIGRMSCNPAIGGQAKGHLVREIDALGGMMGLIIDQAGIHFKMLNRSKGPAVWSPRAQADRDLYESVAQDYLFKEANLTIIESVATDLLIENSKVIGLKIANELIYGSSIILTCGTFLNGQIHIGLKNYSAGRSGEPAATGITETLIREGFKVGRLKTGTPPRVDIDSIDWSKVDVQKADNPPEPFSFRTEMIRNRQIDMYITYTHQKTHEYLREGLSESPMYTGRIQGVGPRYCPSIEDKIVRFADKERHQIFLEPEGYTIPEVYINGFSTSLPESAQINALRSLPGLENCKILRLGYAIEYDFFEPFQLKNTLETKRIEQLYFAGQICGTSGYEEAAAQGFIAGVNAVLKLQNKEPFVLDRSESYIAVLIDDLINKSTLEPYRMFTSSAEFRLLLRHDNADLRLMNIGYELGLIHQNDLNKKIKKENDIENCFDFIQNTLIRKEEYDLVRKVDSAPLQHSETVHTLLKRPENHLNTFLNLEKTIKLREFSEIVRNHVEFEVKYEGYIKRQNDEVLKFREMEDKLIPEFFDYDKIVTLSNEAREKLKKIRPKSLGQAGRISGLRPSDLNVLSIFLEKVS